jgi:predicted AAA+ superfamily ATPase
MSVFSPDEISTALRAMNPWWRGGRPPAGGGLRRTAFREAREWLDGEGAPNLLLLEGPRWVGKTFLLYQLIEDLLEGGRAPERILYLSYTTSLFDFSDLEQLAGLHRAEAHGAPEHVFVDEADRVPGGPASVSAWAGRNPGARVVATVSPAALTEGVRDSLGPHRMVPVHPLSFSEFLTMRRIAPRRSGPPRSLSRYHSLSADEWNQLILKWGDLELFLADYLVRGGFPRSITEADLARAHRALRENVLEESLARDAAVYSGARNPSEYRRLFTYIAYRSGEIWNAAGLAEELVISGGTVLDYLDHLERSELVYAATNYREERGEAVRIRRKFFPADPSLRNALLFRGEPVTERVEEVEKAVATAVMAHLFRRSRERDERVYFWRDGSHEVDFVMLNPRGKPVPVAVRCGAKVGRSDVRSLLRFMEQYQAPRGVVVTWGRENHGPLQVQSDLFEKPEIVRIPAWLFLHACGPQDGAND